MKIIHPGQSPGGRVHRGICDKCDCVYEFSEGEARRVNDQRDGDSWVTKCPTCNYEVWTRVR